MLNKLMLFLAVFLSCYVNAVFINGVYVRPIQCDEIDLPNELFRAACEGDVTRVQELIQQGANVHKRNSLRESTLHITRSPGVVKVLSDAGADVDARDRYGSTPLHEALYPEVAKALLEAGANPHLRDDFGQLPVRPVLEEARQQMSRAQSTNQQGQPAYVSTLRVLADEPNKSVVEGLIETLVEAGVGINEIMNQCHYTNERKVAGGSICGSHLICVSEVTCSISFGGEEDNEEPAIVPVLFQSICKATGSGECPSSALDCVLDSSIMEDKATARRYPVEPSEDDIRRALYPTPLEYQEDYNAGRIKSPNAPTPEEYQRGVEENERSRRNMWRRAMEMERSKRGSGRGVR
ncbi:MAG: ankyrin repeat domain-containing protein [Bdellovibrionales bacterium]|nr:ankyrin repeat domain-containing protein [Bdellovibrionales bacterium]